MSHGVSSVWCRSQVYRQGRAQRNCRMPGVVRTTGPGAPSAPRVVRGTRLAEPSLVYRRVHQSQAGTRHHSTHQGNAMTDRLDSSRRRALAQLSAGSLATLAPWAMQAALAQAKPLTVGVIYVGPRDDFGYNQAQAQAAAEVKKLPGVKVVEEENVPETTAVQKTMTGMIQQDGAKVAVPDLVRLLRSARARARAQVPRRPLLALRRPVDREEPEERRQLLRLRRGVPVPERRHRRPHDEDARSSASSPPSRSRRC